MTPPDDHGVDVDGDDVRIGLAQLAHGTEGRDDAVPAQFAASRSLHHLAHTAAAEQALSAAFVDPTDVNGDVVEEFGPRSPAADHDGRAERCTRLYPTTTSSSPRIIEEGRRHGCMLMVDPPRSPAAALPLVALGRGA
jgi:hypothetical protein